MEEMDIKEIFFIMWDKKWFIILVTILSIVVSFLVSTYIIDKQYTTYTTLILGKASKYNNQQIEYQDVLLNQKLIKTYGEIAKSRLVVNEVINNLNLNMEYYELCNNIDVSLVNGTEVIKISINGYNQITITEIANETAKVFMKRVNDIMKIDNIKIIDNAIVPSSSIKPNVMLNTAIVGVIGFIVSVLLVLLFEILDDSIKMPSEIEEKFHVTIIGTIPYFIEE